MIHRQSISAIDDTARTNSNPPCLPQKTRSSTTKEGMRRSRPCSVQVFDRRCTERGVRDAEEEGTSTSTAFSSLVVGSPTSSNRWLVGVLGSASRSDASMVLRWNKVHVSRGSSRKARVPASFERFRIPFVRGSHRTYVQRERNSFSGSPRRRLDEAWDEKGTGSVWKTNGTKGREGRSLKGRKGKDLEKGMLSLPSHACSRSV